MFHPNLGFGLPFAAADDGGARSAKRVRGVGLSTKAPEVCEQGAARQEQVTPGLAGHSNVPPAGHLRFS